MPQLDKVTFLSQFFWLCVFYLGFYYVLYKHFLPKISRILALRKRKMNVSQEGIESVYSENHKIRKHSDNILSKGFSLSRTLFHNFFSHATGWVDNTANSVNTEYFNNINKTYLNSLGETSLSQHILLYHASPNIPENLTIKILLEKIKSLKNLPQSNIARHDVEVSPRAETSTIQNNGETRKKPKK
jgi:hypothetical protein